MYLGPSKSRGYGLPSPQNGVFGYAAHTEVSEGGKMRSVLLRISGHVRLIHKIITSRLCYIKSLTALVV